MRAADFDAIIVGAGLGGLSAALHLQSKGMQVALVERNHRVGGLCGTFTHSGREFVIACNDFGSAMPRFIQQLGVDVEFYNTSTTVAYGNQRFSMPFTLPMFAKMLPYTGDILRYFRSLNKSKKLRADTHPNLETLVNTTCRHRLINDLLKLPAYLMGVAPNQFHVSSLFNEFKFGYGYMKPTAPVGGPQAMVDAMQDRFVQNGTLMLRTSCLSIRRDKSTMHVETDRGTFTTHHAVDATSRHSDIEIQYPPGLPVSMFLLVVSKDFPYPEGVHTLVHYPPDISSWFTALDQKEMPEKFGFHVFCSDLPNQDDYYTANLYFYLPRGIQEPGKQLLHQAETYIMQALEELLPGIGAALLERHFISPNLFEKIHGISSRVTPLITPPSFKKRQNYDPRTGIYHAGAAVYPPGEHAGAAILSGELAAQGIAEATRGGL